MEPHLHNQPSYNARPANWCLFPPNKRSILILNPYTVLLARPGASGDNCDTFLCFVLAGSPEAALQDAAIDAAAADGDVWQPTDYRALATFAGFHPDVSI